LFYLFLTSPRPSFVRRGILPLTKGELEGVIRNIAIFILSFGLLFTFSRGTILFFIAAAALFFAGVFLFRQFREYRKHARRLACLVILSWVLIIAAAWPEVSTRFLESSVSERAVQERLFFNKVGTDTIRQNYSQLFFGVGMGNFVHHYMQSLPGLSPHLYQPVHNIFILIASEVGIFGFLAFILFLALLLKNPVRIFIALFPRRHQDQDIQNQRDRVPFVYLWVLVCMVCFIVLVGMYDHYFWTLQQGGLMFWISLGLLAGVCKKHYNLSQ
jgi:O-antigen ligase